jgi:predicted nucleotidyltransferase component of viral defense system
VLNIIGQSGTDFFLTGGTALSRAYYHHRYSDDLDFFVNNCPDFDEQADLVFDRLRAKGFWWDDHEEFIRNDHFITLKIHWNKSDTALKLDFVDDLVPHFGEIASTPFYCRVDPIRNILSNKLSAIFRFAAKDIADIREIARHESFNWHDMVNEAREKEGGLEIPLLNDILGGIPKNEFERVIWCAPAPSWETFKADIRRIVSDMMNCGENTLSL